MAHTPYPPNSRENPSIVASNDRTTWVEPDGITNPVVPQSEATDDGFSANSDVDLLFDGDTLVLYWRSQDGTTPAEALYRKTSTDGVTWSARTQMLTSDTANTLLSPSVLLRDGTWHLWVIEDPGSGNNLVHRYTSADGITWGSKTACTIPSTVDAWHIDIIYANGAWRALLNTQTAWDLLVWYSLDGLEWFGDNNTDLEPSGDTWDEDGHYRATWTPVVGVPYEYDIWFTGINDGGTGNIFSVDAEWRIGHLRRSM